MDFFQTQQITSEQKQLERYAQHRQQKFQQSLQGYLNHIKKQTEQLEETQILSEERNKKISGVFEGVYERIMMGSQILVRKVKQTSYEKKIFWENLIANNADMPDLELKKDFYQQKRDAQDIYYDAIEAQKMKKIPYSDLLGKIKSDHSLKNWQDNNKKFQQKVNQGTKTLHNWKKIEDQKAKQEQIHSIDDSTYFLHQFTQPETNQWIKPIKESRYSNVKVANQENSVLKDFFHRKI